MPLYQGVRPDLAEELRRRAERDQAARHAEDGAEMRRVDVDNTAWLEKVLAEHGWPGTGLVGRRGADDAWLLTQHADLDLQRWAVQLLKAAVATGDAPARHLAFLQDRVLIAGGKRQMYGTQYTLDEDGLRRLPVADAERLDERRRAMGLEPAAEYDRRMRA